MALVCLVSALIINGNGINLADYEMAKCPSNLEVYLRKYLFRSSNSLEHNSLDLRP